MGLDLNHPLYKLDTAYFDREWGRIPSPEYIILNSGHILPKCGIFRVVDAAIIKSVSSHKSPVTGLIWFPAHFYETSPRGETKGRAVVTYICLNTRGYKLAAASTICFKVTVSFSGNSNVSRSVCNAVAASCSF